MQDRTELAARVERQAAAWERIATALEGRL